MEAAQKDKTLESKISSRHRHSVQQHIYPLRTRSLQIPSALQISSLRRRTTDTGALKEASQSCSEFSTSASSQFSPSRSLHSESTIGSRIPFLTTEGGTSTATTSLRSRIPPFSNSETLSRPRISTQLKVTERSIPSASKNSCLTLESMNTSEITPLPILRRNFLPGSNNAIQLLGSETREAGSENLEAAFPHVDASITTEGITTTQAGPSNSFSPLTNSTTEESHQTTSRPPSTSTTADSTTTSLRQRYYKAAFHEELMVPALLKVTPEPHEIHKCLLKNNAVSRVISIEVAPSKASQKSRRFSIRVFLMLLCIHASFLLAVLNEFSSRRCWTADSKVLVSKPLTTPISSARIICSPRSAFRFIPSSLRPFLHLQVLGDPPLLFSSTGVGSWHWRMSTEILEQSVLRPMMVSVQQLVSILTQRFSFYGLSGPLTASTSRPSVEERNQHPNNSSSDETVFESVRQSITQLESTGVIEQALWESQSSRFLRDHSNEFKRRIEHVTANVYVAIGYGLANVVIIQTDEGLILFDTLENPSNMRQLMECWNKQQEQQHREQTLAAGRVIAIVYSHFHADHVFGASAVYHAGVTQIWAHEKTDVEISKVFTLTAGTTYKRSMRQFGGLLSEDDGYINAGIGQHLDYDATEVATAIRPTHIWKGNRTVVEIGGEELVLIYAPGESRDQSIVWMPKKQLLYGADNIYKSFPNIYAIRGTESRDAMMWVKSLDTMRELKPEFLVLGHTGVLRGRETTYSTLTAYRDAIQFVHDQTVRYMNKGYPVDDIVQVVHLPPHLHGHPYLQQYYGTVDSAVRAVFHHYLGWFSGLSEELQPLARPDKAAKMAHLVGGRIQLLQRSIEALQKKEYQWSLELVSYAHLVLPSCEITRRIKADVLRILAGAQSSAPGRNWYLTSARETEEAGSGSCVTNHHNHDQSGYQKRWERGKHWLNCHWNQLGYGNCSQRSGLGKICEKMRVTKSQKNQCIWNLHSAADTLDFIPIRVRAEAALNMESVLAFTFTDTQHFACVHFRRGIAYVAPKCEHEADMHVYTDDQTWRSIISDKLQPFVAVITGRLWIKSANPLVHYLRLRNILSLVEIDME